jgi:hypothetical protein
LLKKNVVATACIAGESDDNPTTCFKPFACICSGAGVLRCGDRGRFPTGIGDLPGKGLVRTGAAVSPRGDFKVRDEMISAILNNPEFFARRR